ncbi:MAG: hypothetical protein JSU93_06735 [Methanobacteriota archaeon]|nr:MAG: hypothetical protein JSU93_06735 [Euryarchaeota archaeon]
MSEAQAQQPRNCVSCGRSIAWDANVCPYCGHDFRTVMAPAQAQKKDSAMPLVGGILIILASIGYFVGGGLLVAGGAVGSWFDVGEGAIAVVCGAILLVLGILALLGGVYAIQKKSFVLALLAGILTIPSILGLIGLILVAVSKDEFSS